MRDSYEYGVGFENEKLYIPRNITYFSETKLSDAYKNDSNFKIVDIKVYQNEFHEQYNSYLNKIVIVLLDNNGKVWTCGEHSPVSSTDRQEFICISDIAGTALNNKYKADSSFKIVDVQNTIMEIAVCKYSFKDSNDDIWVWGYNYNGSLGVGSNAIFVVSPYCLSQKMNVKIKKIKCYGGTYYNSKHITFIIDTSGKVWGCGGINNNLLCTTSSTKVLTPVRIGSTMTDIDDMYIINDYAYAYGKNAIWCWGASQNWGDETQEQQITPIKISSEITVKKQIFGSIILDTNGKVWTMGNKSYCGYKTNNDYNPLTCLSDMASSELYGVNIVDCKLNESVSTSFGEQVGGSFYGAVFLDSNNNAYKYSCGYRTNEDVTKSDNRLFDNCDNEYYGELNGKDVVKIRNRYALDSEGKLYISSYYPMCLTDRQYYIEKAVNTNKILINNPIKNKLNGLKIKELINDNFVKDENDNYYYFGSRGESLNVTEAINNRVNPLYNKKIISVFDNKLVLTSEREIYNIELNEARYITTLPQGVEIEQIYNYWKDDNYCIILDKTGKIWTCGYGRFGQLGNNSLEIQEQLVCISDIEGTEFSKAYNNQNFKIEKLYIMYSYPKNHSIIALDNNGKV